MMAVASETGRRRCPTRTSRRTGGTAGARIYAKKTDNSRRTPAPSTNRSKGLYFRRSAGFISQRFYAEHRFWHCGAGSGVLTGKAEAEGYQGQEGQRVSIRAVKRLSQSSPTVE